MITELRAMIYFEEADGKRTIASNASTYSF